MAVAAIPPYWVRGAGGALDAPRGPMPLPRITWAVPLAAVTELTGALKYGNTENTIFIQGRS